MTMKVKDDALEALSERLGNLAHDYEEERKKTLDYE